MRPETVVGQPMEGFVGHCECFDHYFERDVV